MNAAQQALSDAAEDQPEDAALGREHTEGDHSWHCVPDAYAIWMRQQRGDRLLAQLSASLDTAWQEAEAALPEGVTFTLTRAIRPVSERSEPTYYATVTRPWTPERVASQVSGETPALALKALALALRAGATS